MAYTTALAVEVRGSWACITTCSPLPADGRLVHVTHFKHISDAIYLVKITLFTRVSTQKPDWHASWSPDHLHDLLKSCTQNSVAIMCSLAWWGVVEEIDFHVGVGSLVLNPWTVWNDSPLLLPSHGVSVEVSLDSMVPDYGSCQRLFEAHNCTPSVPPTAYTGSYSHERIDERQFSILNSLQYGEGFSIREGKVSDSMFCWGVAGSLTPYY